MYARAWVLTGRIAGTGTRRTCVWQCAAASDLGNLTAGFTPVDAVVAAEGVGLQEDLSIPAPPVEEFHGAIPTATGGVIKDCLGMIRFADVHPEPPGLGRAGIFPIQHIHRRVVGMDDPGGQHFFDHEVVQRPEGLGTLGHPVAHGGAAEEYVMAFQNPFQPVQGLVIGILAHDDVGQQSRRRQTLLNGRQRLVGDDDLRPRSGPPRLRRHGRHTCGESPGGRTPGPAQSRASR